jgi:hypothetical protein
MVYDGDLVLPEYVVDFEYLTKVWRNQWCLDRPLSRFLSRFEIRW